jgi:hypothetical protein
MCSLEDPLVFELADIPAAKKIIFILLITSLETKSG